MRNLHKTKISQLVLILSLFIAGAQAQAPRPMTALDLLNIPSLSDPRLSPDGTHLLCTLSEADWAENRRIGHIWRTSVDSGSSIQMTNGVKGESSARWSPDGNWIAFLANRQSKEGEESEGTQIFLIRGEGGEAQQLTNHDTAISSIEWAPDGKSIYFLAPEPKTADEKKKEELKDDVITFDEDFKQTHLWNITLKGKTESRITQGDFSVIEYNLSPDGTLIAHHRAPSPLYDDTDEGEVWVMNADGGNARQLTHNTVVERGARLSPDNTRVLFTTDSNAQFETYYNENLFVIPAAGGRARLLLPEMPYEVTRAVWSGDGGSIFFTANAGVRRELFRVELPDEKLHQLTRGDHAVGSYQYLPKLKRHVFTVNKATSPGEVYVLNENGENGPRAVTHIFDDLTRRYRIPRQEAVQWKGADGVTVEGLLYYPLDYQEGHHYPLCVQTHGGPAAADSFGFGGWSSYVQVLTGRGWAVFRPNYRGSTGYGDAYLRDMVGHYYHQAHLDVMTGVDYLIERGIADGDRMVKMGWSGGGHMTNKIITFTDRFKAAASGAGAVNWISMYAQSDVRIYRTPWFGGTPWQEDAPIAVYWDNSPLKDIWKVKTPTIILVGKEDVRVPAPQSIELYRALKSNGVPTHLYIAPREPHGWRELRHELFKINVELAWFEKYALGREYQWEKAPDEESETGTPDSRSPQ